MISKLLFSLQFRLVVGFALVLFLTLSGVSIYLGRVADREARRLEQDIEDVRASRIEQVVSRYLKDRTRRVGLQGTLEHVGSLYGWRIVVNDVDGRLLADSNVTLSRQALVPPPGRRRMPIMDRGHEVASVLMSQDMTPEGGPEPTASRMASALNRSLLWAGLGGGLGGIALVTLVSGRVLDPVRKLRFAARDLGQGDLSQRVSAPGHGEIGELGRTFNTMAEGLERAEQQRRNLMADVAHELRTPLSNIQGYLEAVRDGMVEPNEETIDTITGQVALLSHLVEDLRVLALAEAGSLSLDLQPDSLEEVLRATVESFGPRAHAKGVELHFEVPEGLRTVVMDRVRIAQVTSNLVENAIFHTPEGGRVSLTARAAGAHIEVSVQDTGPGIASDELPFVFDRFYRVDPSRSRATGGAGLGLTIAKQLVEAHGGTIRAESTPGAGSRFIFELPVSQV
jgi:signal transduction histidine kinase